MTITTLEHFPSCRIQAVAGGCHLIGVPVPQAMAGSPDERVALGQAMRRMPR